MERRARIKFGIIGNMGPKADELIQRELRIATKAGDREGIYIVVVKNPNIPDRTEAILKGGADPVEEIVDAARTLEAASCQFGLIACNTAHYFLEQVQARTSLRLLNMIQITGDYIVREFPDKKIALVATNGTVRTGVYHRFIPNLITPDPAYQDTLVHETVLSVKKRDYPAAEKLLVEAVGKLAEQGVNVVVLGCTELPLAQKTLERTYPQIIFVNPAAIVAKEVDRIYRNAQAVLKDGAQTEDALVKDIVRAARVSQIVRS